MSKWKNPYVIRVAPGPRYEVLGLVFNRRHEPRLYRFIDSYPTFEQAMKKKLKLYGRN